MILRVIDKLIDSDLFPGRQRWPTVHEGRRQVHARRDSFGGVRVRQVLQPWQVHQGLILPLLDTRQDRRQREGRRTPLAPRPGPPSFYQMIKAV